MNIFIQDSQLVGETEATVFTLIQQSSTPTSVFLTNQGTNALTYRFQEQLDGTWTDIGEVGTSTNGALVPNQSIAVLIDSTATSVRLVGNASGGTRLDFSVSRLAVRAAGGPLPILTL